MTKRQIAVTYFFVQAVAVVGWWVLLLAAPMTRQNFAIRGASFTALGSFALGDLAIIALGSILVATRAGAAWTVCAAWLVSGALLYATCFVVVAAITGVTSPFGAVLMIPASVASFAASVILSRDAHTHTLPPSSSA
jgi:hypothetical protein